MPRKGNYKHKAPQTKASSPKDAVHPVIINRHRRVVGELPNYTNNNTQPFHSGIEHDWLLTLDVEATEFHAIEFTAQSEQFKFEREGTQYRYTPDVFVTYNTGQLIFQEVKPDDVVGTQEFQDRWELCTEVLGSRGHQLELVTESEIRREPRYSTVRELQAYRSIWPVPDVTLLIDDVLGDGGRLPIGQLSHSFPDPVFARQVIYNLILRKHLTINFDRPFNADTLVWKV